MKRIVKRIIKTAAIVLALLIVIGGVASGIFRYNNMHWYDKYQNSLNEVGAVE